MTARFEELYDYARANAWRAPDGLVFRIGEPVAATDAIRLEGVLVNESSAATEVIVFPAYLVLEPAPGETGLTRRPRPPMPPPVPPPPMRFELAAHERLAFSAALLSAEWSWVSGSDVELAWTFTYWTEPKPRGRFRVRCP